MQITLVQVLRTALALVVVLVAISSYVESYAIDPSEGNDEASKDYELAYMKNMVDEYLNGDRAYSPLQKRGGYNYKRASINQLIAELERLSGNRYSHNVRPMRFGPMGR